MDKNKTREDVINDIILKTIDKHKEEDLIESYKILQKLLQNLSDNSYVDKYKMFKKTNATIKAKVLKIPEVLEILAALGYRETDSDTLTWQDNDINLVTKIAENLTMFLSIIESKLTNRKILELAEKNPETKAFLEEQKRLQQKKLEEENRLKDIMETHKQEIKSNWVKQQDSTANKLEFGSTECRFQPKNNQRG